MGKLTQQNKSKRKQRSNRMTIASPRRQIAKSLIATLLSAIVLPSTVSRADTQASRLLIDGDVVNAETGEPIKTFRVIPGVRYNRAPGVRGNIAVWQPHMIREMTEGEFHWPRTRGYDEMRFRVEATGYRPATTTWLGKGGPHLRMKIHLRPDPGIEGTVLTPDGKVASKATLAIGLPNRTIQLQGRQIAGHGKPRPNRLSDQWRVPTSVMSNDQGRFVLPYETDSAAVLCVVHESGYFEQSCNEFTRSIADSDTPVEIKLEKWGRVDGQVLWKDKPGAGETIRATVHRNEPYPGLIAAYDKVEADEQGNYSFRNLLPGNVQLGHLVNSPEQQGPQQLKYEYPVLHVSLEPGQIETMDFGGEGIDVQGRLTGLNSYENVSIAIRPPAPDVWGFRRFNGAGANGLQRGYQALQDSDYAPLYFREGVKVNDDGTFEIDDVMTGQYNLWVHGATGASQFTVQTTDEDAIDLGTIQVKPK